MSKMYSIYFTCLVLNVLFSCFCDSAPSVKEHDYKVYHGLIREDAAEGERVELDHQLIVRDWTGLEGDEICGYTIYKNSDSELPFKIVLIDSRSKTGAADIVLAEGYKLNFEQKQKYHFEFAAHDCVNSFHTERKRIHVSVEDVNEYSPTWKNTSYVVEVEEGVKGAEILQLEATDEDGSEDYASICIFHLLSTDVPFTVDSDGVLRNTEVLDYSRRHNYILEVKAEDCGGSESRMSDKLVITVLVKPTCAALWRGVPENVEYVAGAPASPMLRDANLDLCERPCEKMQVSARISLTPNPSNMACDRDTYSIRAQRRLCGATPGAIDLLPSSSLPLWTDESEAEDASKSGGASSRHLGDEIYSFDGATTAIEVPAGKMNHTLNEHFTISVWMKHGAPGDDDLLADAKEHIVCNADGDGMNRHHYSLFLHNCKLVFLLRQEYAPDKDLNEFKPAEWRWKLPQVCDGQWHHYAVSVDFPQVEVYVDGHIFLEHDDNREIIDDWPLRQASDVHFTKLVVGACWHGAENALVQHFHGYLADVSILPDKSESSRVIQCLNNCGEKLDFHAMSEMDTGMSVALNSDMTQITINGHNKSSVEKLIRLIGYMNARTFPIPGKRDINLDTTVTCDGDVAIDISPVHFTVDVQEIKMPEISIEGSPVNTVAEDDVTHGYKILRDVSITLGEHKKDEDSAKEEVSKEEGDEDDAEEEVEEETAAEGDAKLDSCMIHVDPPLKTDLEQLVYPDNLLSQLKMEAYDSDKGLVLAGSAFPYQYERVLREVRYMSKHPEELNSRSFSLTCSVLDGRFSSQPFHVKIEVTHEHHEAPPPPPPNAAEINIQSARVAEPIRAAAPQHKEYLQSPIGPLGVAGVMHTGGTSATGAGMIIIVVVCLGFLTFMIVLGILRVRSSQQQKREGGDDKAEMEWDNSALTITVNPMEQEMYGEGQEEGACAAGDMSDESDADSEAGGNDGEDDSSDDEVVQQSRVGGMGKGKCHELEWDDSTV